MSSITFQMSVQTSPAPLSSASTAAVTTPPIGNLTSNLQSIPAQAPDIDFLSPSAFARAACLNGSVTFSLDKLSWVCELCTATTSDPVDLLAIPPSYHEFVDVFSKSKANTLTPHCEYDLRIVRVRVRGLRWISTR